MATHVLTSVVTMVTHMLTSAVTMVSFSVTLFEACLICLLYVPWAWTFSWFLYPNLISDQCWQFSPALPSILSSILNQSRYPLPNRILGHLSLSLIPLSLPPSLPLPDGSQQEEILQDKYNPPRYRLLWDISRPKSGTEHIYKCMMNYASNCGQWTYTRWGWLREL